MKKIALAGLAAGVWAAFAPVASARNVNAEQAALEAKTREFIAKMTPEEKISQMMNSAPAIERLGLKPYDLWNEALHGVARNGRATMFPMPIGMAASFSPELIREVGAAVGDEGRAKYCASQKLGRYGGCTGLTFWSPNINIFRDPRWGRGMETWGEDPFLTGSMAVEYVKGMQGDDPVYLKAAGCAKHFAVHSGPEALRHSFDVNPTKKDLFETYLPAFETLVREGKVEAVMGAYNRVWGESASAHEYLFNEILRGRWGFKGHIVSDCGAVNDIKGGHKLEKTNAEASARAVKHGLNAECGGTFRDLKKALAEGLVSEQDLDAALFPLMLTRFKLGIIGDSGACPYGETPEAVIGSAEHIELARRAARESMVLLKNDGALPFNRDTLRSVFVTGAGATDAFALMGNYYGVSGDFRTYLEGIAEAAGAGVGVHFAPGYYYGQEKAVSHGVGDQYCVAVVGNTGVFEGEEGDAMASPRNGDRISMKLPGCQMEFLRKISENCRRGKRKLVTVVTGGSPVEMKEILEWSDAVVFAWYAGQEGGRALADLLFGDYDFTGRLPLTFPVSVDVLPPYEDYAMAGRTYRYQSEGVELPFGYGLSYGKASYKAISVARGDDGDFATVELANEGKTDATEVVEIYVKTPNAGKGHPISSLAGYQRVKVPAGKTVNVRLKLRERAFGEYSEDGEFKAVPGSYTVVAAAAAPGKRSSELGVASVETAVEVK